MYYIGIDVGGTNVKAGLITENGEIMKRAVRPTLAKRESDAIAADMIALVKEVAEGIDAANIHSVGIGIPGACDDKTGMVVNTANINFHMYPLGEKIQAATGFSVYLGNDANCAALGEYYALPEKVQDMILITLGTGVGGGLILNGKLYTGFNGIAGEVGHIMLKDGGEKCGCGRRGCWEAYASVSALIRQTRDYALAHPDSALRAACGENMEAVSGKTAFVLARKGDADGKAVVDTWISYVAGGIVDMVNIFQPALLLIGGAISKEGEMLLNPIRSFVAQNSYSPDVAKTKIDVAALGNDAGLIGAAFLGRK